MSRFSVEARKNEAIAMIETYYVVSKRNGFFAGDPGETARMVVAIACAKYPGLAANHFHSFVLPAACLTVLLMDPQESLATREYLAMAVYGMLQGAKAFPKPYSLQEQKYLELAELVYSQFREEHPEEPIAQATPSQSPAERNRAMNELITRMKA